METYFITGAQGCIGSWIVKSLCERGDTPVVFDRSDDPRRLLAIMEPRDLERVRFVVGDITDISVVRSALEAARARCIIHLAGLQVPTCKADPVAGAFVNVVGTLNVFESAKALGLARVIYASSAAVFGASNANSPLGESAQSEPATHYGVFKRTNEGNARVYFLEHGLSSVGLRPLTTKAMKAAVLGLPFHIRFSGATDFQYVADTAAAFIACADAAPAGAHVFNLHGETVGVERIAELINRNSARPDRELVSYGGPPIPIAAAMDDAAIRRVIGELPSTPLEAGVRETMRRFAVLRDARRLDMGDLEPELARDQEKAV